MTGHEDPPKKGADWQDFLEIISHKIMGDLQFTFSFSEDNKEITLLCIFNYS